MSPPSTLEIQVNKNEKAIILLEERQKEIGRNMGTKLDEIKSDFKSLNNKVIGGMGIIIMFLLGIIFQK